MRKAARDSTGSAESMHAMPLRVPSLETSNGVKTIFITCFTGLISRNILATDAFDVLRTHEGVRIVIITPESQAEALRREFGGANVLVVGVPTPPLRGRDKLWWTLATHLLNTRTRSVQRRAKLARDGKRLKYRLSHLLGILGGFSIVRKLFRFSALAFIQTGEFEDLFRHYQPALLFSTDVYTPQDVKLMRLAKKLGIRTVGMVRSWDNITSKTLLAFIPEYLIVQTDWLKGEIARHGDVRPNDIFVINGIPHYDRYRAEGRTPREDFFRKINLDPSGKLILFTPPSDNYLKHDPITPVVLRALEAAGAQILVRKALVGAIDLGDYQPPPGVVFDEPGTSPDFTKIYLSRAADQHLADSIYHSDLVVTWASTMIIDAAVFLKPILLVGFDASSRPFEKSILQYYEYDHQRRILELGGARLAKSPSELTEWTKRYLVDRNLDLAGRRRIVREYCGILDGQAGKRLAAHLLRFL